MSSGIPIFILGCHKSGTSLFRALLDDHSELMVIPFESHFFKLAGYWIDYPLKRGVLEKLTLQDKIERLVSYIKTLNRQKDQDLKYADSNTSGEWDIDLFKRTLNTNIQNTEEELFYSYVNAIFDSLEIRKNGQGDKIVEKSVEHLELVPVIRSIFPNSKFIHLVRNPYANLVALRRKYQQCPFLLDSVQSIYKSLYHANNNGLAFDGYKIVRFEDVILNTGSVLQTVSEFLEIKYESSLEQPTSMGELWGGNSTSDATFKGISQKPLKNWKDKVTPFELDLVNTLLGEVLSRFDYKKRIPEKTTQVYKFIPGESLKRYVLNRAMLQYFKRVNKYI
ncbi:sulfotransferase family protein [Halalkalibaculum sp. DA3122]|uniref:sulfotransferase family protein n=1 Tax=Halalkalibaculum sp. DA3122 TaxID=3373607 RepID=UPI0037541413